MLRTVAAYSAPFIQRIPQIGKIRGALALTSLFTERFFRTEKSDAQVRKDLFLFVGGLSTGVQIVACLGSTRLFKSYWVSVPTSTVILLVASLFPVSIESKKSKARFVSNQQDQNLKGTAQLKYRVYLLASRMNQVGGLIQPALTLLNLTSKVVNSFAIGHLAHRTFSKSTELGLIMVATTVVTLMFSCSNVRYSR